MQVLRLQRRRTRLHRRRETSPAMLPTAPVLTDSVQISSGCLQFRGTHRGGTHRGVVGLSGARLRSAGRAGLRVYLR